MPKLRESFKLELMDLMFELKPSSNSVILAGFLDLEVLDFKNENLSIGLDLTLEIFYFEGVVMVRSLMPSWSLRVSIVLATLTWILNFGAFLLNLFLEILFFGLENLSARAISIIGLVMLYMNFISCCILAFLI